MDFIGEININGVENFAKKIETLAAKYAVNNNVFYSVIPSKSYFINDNLKTPYDYNKMFEILGNNIKSAKYINITDSLFLTDYYITDPHWRQDKLEKTVNTLGTYMGYSVDFSKLTINEINNFKGQHGYNKTEFPTETIYYYTDAHIENAVVKHEKGSLFNKIYEMEKLSSSSPYDMFLSGPSAIATIKNENASTDKELVIFRDSYSCNLAPLLTSVYKEITLIDLRYVMSTLIDMFVKIENKDVLFLYNDRIINNGEMLKVLINN